MGYSFKKPVEVHATAIPVVAIEVAIAAAMTALGIGVAGTVSNQDYSQMIEKIKTNAVEQAYANCTAAIVAGKTVVNMTHEFLWTVGTQFMLLYNAIFPPAVPPVGDGVTLSGDITVSTLSEWLGTSSVVIQDTSQVMHDLTIVSTFISDIGDQVIQFGASGEGQNYIYISSAGGYLIAKEGYPGYSKTTIYSHAIQSGYAIYVCRVLRNISGRFLPFYVCLLHFGDRWVLDNRYTSSYEGQDEFNVARDKFYADGLSALNNTLSDVLDKMRDRLGLGTDVDVPVSVPSDKVDDKLRDVTQDKVLGKDIATEDDKAKDEDTNKDKDTTPPKPGDLPNIKVPSAITKKFPFSIPWDFARILGAFYPTERKAPYFEWPIKFQRLGINEKIVLDLSSFDGIADIARWFEFAAYALGLILLTRKLIGAGGGD